MSREFETSGRANEQSSTQTHDGGKDDGRSAGVTIDRIASADPFWTKMAALNHDGDKHGLESLLVDAHYQHRLDSLIRTATSDQMSILFNAMPIVRGGGVHTGPIGVALWVIFEAIPVSSPGMKRLVFEARFHVNVIGHDVTNREEQEWDSAGLRRLWLALSVLPNADVEGNDKLVHFVRYKQGTPNALGGGFYDGTSAAAVNYDPASIATTTQASSTQVNKGDPLENVNRFDKVMRHEVGHAVDERDNFSGRYCPTEAGGRWTTRSSAEDWIKEIMAQHGNKMLGYSPSAIATALLALGKTPATDEALRKAIAPSAHTADPLFKVIASAWNDFGGMSGTPDAAEGTRAFHRIDGWYYSYDLAARSRQVSNYQFHAPAEWFAEAYSAYYEPDSRGLGAKLQDRDAGTKIWFDQHVHKH